MFEIFAGAPLRKKLLNTGLLRIPGCFDALSSKLLVEAGFECGFLSGFGVSAARLGLPDAGLMSFNEMLDAVRTCCSAAPNLSIIADGDTGYGNAVNVQRTIFEYSRAGAAAVTIEDQANPKRCGHSPTKQVISRAEAQMNIRAAIAARGQSEMLIIARTDARTVLGAAEALDRCRMFEAEGADVIFLEGAQSLDEMIELCNVVKAPKMVNMVASGKTPSLSTTELEEIGFKLAIYPVDLLSAAIQAMQSAAKNVLSDVADARQSLMPFSELQTLVGFPRYWEVEKRFSTVSEVD